MWSLHVMRSMVQGVVQGVAASVPVTFIWTLSSCILACQDLPHRHLWCLSSSARVNAWMVPFGRPQEQLCNVILQRKLVVGCQKLPFSCNVHASCGDVSASSYIDTLGSSFIVMCLTPRPPPHPCAYPSAERRLCGSITLCTSVTGTCRTSTAAVSLQRL